MADPLAIAIVIVASIVNSLGSLFLKLGAGRLSFSAITVSNKNESYPGNHFGKLLGSNTTIRPNNSKTIRLEKSPKNHFGKLSSSNQVVKPGIKPIIMSFLDTHIIIGITLYFVAAVIYIFAVRLEDISVIFPFIAAQYIWISILAVKYLKERMNILKWSGIGLIVIGMVLIGFGS